MATYVIGDIHGAYKALVEVLHKTPIKKGDTLIFLGDYVDGWSGSALVIEHLLLLKDTYNCVFIRGNHDEWWLEYLKGINEPDETTVASYKKHAIDPQSHRKFFEELKDYYIDDKNRGFVHGGFVSRKGLGHDAYRTNYFWDRDLWRIAKLQLSTPTENEITGWNRFYNHHEVFIGHSVTSSRDPELGCNVWNLDTGAGWDGKLTCMNIDTKEYWQSSNVKDLYPEEKGRK